VTRLAAKPKPIRILHGQSRYPLRTPPHRGYEGGDISDGGDLSMNTRLFVWSRDQGRRKKCGSSHSLQFDRIIPRSPGGAGTAASVELLCGSCNQRKAARFCAPAPLSDPDAAVVLQER
jgi:hypothetical protein